MLPERRLLSAEDVAEILQLSARTVRQRLAEGKMCKFIRLGKSVRVRRATFEEWLAQQEEESLSPGVQWIGG